MVCKGAGCVLLAAASALPLFAQDPEAGVAIVSPTERVLRIDAYRPLDSAAYILASDYQINISAEDPPFACPEDILDTHTSRRNPLEAEHAYVPKGSALEVRFSVSSARYPLNSRSLLDQVVAAYNRKGSFKYRVRQQGDFFSFVPISGKDRTCRGMRIEPLLDHQISVPSEEMGIHSAVAAMESALSQKAQEPVHVNTQDWLNRVGDLTSVISLEVGTST